MRRIFFCLLFVLIQTASHAQCEIEVSPPTAWQGKVISITIVSPEGVSKVEASFLEQSFACYKQGDDYVGIVGVPIDQKTGPQDLKLIITRVNGDREEVSRPLEVQATKFPWSKFWLPPARDKLRAREIIDDEWAEIEKVLLVENPQRLWLGTFTWPTHGEISQGFGQRQIINGKSGSNHRGIDIAVPTGTKVLAPNDGKVVFAKQLKAFGGTIVIDHGQGVFSLYFHLSKFAVAVGDNVMKGSLLAYSGNTGVSSGAHLHWGMSVHNLRVDPKQWVKYEF